MRREGGTSRRCVTEYSKYCTHPMTCGFSSVTGKGSFRSARKLSRGDNVPGVLATSDRPSGRGGDKECSDCLQRHLRTPIPPHLR